MGTAKEIKEDMRFTSELSELLDVMKNIAVFQFRALQSRMERFKRFSNILKGFFKILEASAPDHYLIRPKAGKVCIVVVTSDEGFMGGLNFKIINSAVDNKDFRFAELAVVGDRGSRYFNEMNLKFTSFKGAGEAESRRDLAIQIKDYIMRGFVEERFGKVMIYYPKPLSFITQVVETATLLPISAEFHMEGKTDEVPAIIESPVDGIIEFIVGEFVTEKLTEIFEDSKLSEFAARAIHLEQGGQELVKKGTVLKFQYFRAYHEMIDRSTRELFSTQIILRRKRG